MKPYVGKKIKQSKDIFGRQQSFFLQLMFSMDSVVGFSRFVVTIRFGVVVEEWKRAMLSNISSVACIVIIDQQYLHL